MQTIRLELVGETDATALVAAKVHDYSAFFFDGFHRGVELRATFALERPHRFTGQTLRVKPNECTVFRFTTDDGDVVDAGFVVAIGADSE